jgi:predicted MPP superfamily phosphohydrolase
MQTLIVVIGILLLMVLWGQIEQKFLGITKYTIPSAKLQGQSSMIKIVVLADLHNNSFGKNNERLIKHIRQLSPDMICVVGDMINKKDTCYPSNAFHLIQGLAKSFPVYYSYGNHEQRIEQYTDPESYHHITNKNEIYSTWVEYKKQLEKSNVIFLDNNSFIWNKDNLRIKITGVSIGPEFFERNKCVAMDNQYLKELIGASSDKEFQILLAHNPVYFKEYVKWGADLTLSGHLHGGMVRLPRMGGVISPQAKFFPKYQDGIHTEDDCTMVVSRGLGSHSVMPRLFNVPELIEITLKHK